MKKYGLLLLALSLFNVLQAAAQQRVATLRFSVFDANDKIFRELKTDDVRLTIAKKPIQPSELTFNSDMPISLLILVDSSVSQSEVMPAEKLFAERFISGQLSAKTDRVGVARFAGELRWVHEMNGDFASVITGVREIKFEPPPNYIGGGIVAGMPTSKDSKMGSTSIFDAVVNALPKFAVSTERSNRKAILIISDGVNTYGDKKIKVAVEAALKADVSIYAIGISDPSYDPVDKGTLKKLTEGSGGIFVVPNKKFTDAESLLTRLAVAMRSTYEMKFGLEPSPTLVETSLEISNPSLKSRDLELIQPKGVFSTPN
jgi:Ca-activated chloride channel family protein